MTLYFLEKCNTESVIGRNTLRGNNFGQDTQINITAVSKPHVLTIIKLLHISSS